MGSQGDDALYRRILGPMSDRSSDGGQEEGDSGGSHSSSSSSRGTAAADTDSSSPAGGVASCGSAGDPLFAVVARKPAAADDGEDDRRRRTRVGGGDGGITPANVDPGEAADAFVGPALREMDLQLPRGLEVTPAVLERWRLSYNVLMDDARELGIPSSAIPELPATATAEQIRSARDHLRAILASFLSAGL
ncbi:hypothetical protein PLESTB_000061300 [Pleodorina starrii]|uniref:Uncharacterized protein n=1 Tax=Pleodorina starrii TaxID=330485 RepID=A0A9W6EXL1_9CHLO|nr:hypothetical protein PLESTB_000061300 [Pleodorina starrii]GLC67369.1 hypothetical protein PLESTF_000548600 [Pleodorina starrii]